MKRMMGTFKSEETADSDKVSARVFKGTNKGR